MKLLNSWVTNKARSDPCKGAVRSFVCRVEASAVRKGLYSLSWQYPRGIRERRSGGVTTSPAKVVGRTEGCCYKTTLPTALAPQISDRCREASGKTCRLQSSPMFSSIPGNELLARRKCARLPVGGLQGAFDLTSDILIRLTGAGAFSADV